jgi:hypothetical protein
MENEQVNKPDTSKRLPELDFKNELMIKLIDATNISDFYVGGLADEIISMFKNRGKYGKSPYCQCKDSQDSYAQLIKGVRTGKIICFDCNKPYGGTNNENEPTEIFLHWDLNSPGVSSFWYWNKLGKSFKVKACTCKGDLNDVEDIGTYEPTDLYMITEGEYKGNVILKKHCKIQ